jgi:hypothetical protein
MISNPLQIIGAPMFFSTVWGWIKRWFDPVTVSKIFVLSAHEVKPTLEKFVDPANIPVKYGGQLQFNFGDKPTKDPAWEGVIAWEDGLDNFPIGPMIWRDVEGGTRRECVTLGREGGKDRRFRVCTIPKTWPPAEAEVEKAVELEANKGEVNGVLPEAAPPVIVKEGIAGTETTPAPVAAAEATTPDVADTKIDSAAASDPAEPAETVEAEPEPKEDVAVKTMGQAVANLTVAEAVKGKKADPELAEKVPAADVEPALPTTVA